LGGLSAERWALRLQLAGAVLLACALLTGLAIPSFANARMGLSAHLTGVECGLMLIAFGLIWPRLRLSERTAMRAAAANAIGAWALWLAFALGATLGTGEATPIAGAGFRAGAVAEASVGWILSLGVLGTLSGVFAVVFGLVQSSRLE